MIITYEFIYVAHPNKPYAVCMIMVCTNAGGVFIYKIEDYAANFKQTSHLGNINKKL